MIKKAHLRDMNKNYIISALLIVILFLFVSLENRKQDVEALKARNSEISNKLDNYANALYKANENIEIANDRMEDAKSWEGSSQTEMSNALNALETVDTVK